MKVSYWKRFTLSVAEDRLVMTRWISAPGWNRRAARWNTDIGPAPPPYEADGRSCDLVHQCVSYPTGHERSPIAEDCRRRGVHGTDHRRRRRCPARAGDGRTRHCFDHRGQPLPLFVGPTARYWGSVFDYSPTYRDFDRPLSSARHHCHRRRARTLVGSPA